MKRENFKSLGLKMLFVGVLMLSIGIYLLNGLTKDFTKESDSLKSHIGETVIIKKDTLIIVDYSYLNDNFTLSNGTKVSTGIIKINK